MPDSGISLLEEIKVVAGTHDDLANLDGEDRPLSFADYSQKLTNHAWHTVDCHNGLFTDWK